MSAVDRLRTSASQGLPHPWTDLLLPYFPSAPPELIEQTLMRVLRMWFTRTLSWTGTSPTLVAPGTMSRFVVPAPEPETNVIHVFEGITVPDGWRLADRAVVNNPEPSLQADQNRWWIFKAEREGAIEFEAPPPARTAMRFLVAMEPRTANMPESIAREVQNPVIAGVRAQMHGMTLKPWYDRAAARDALGEFERAVGAARVRARYGLSSASLKQSPMNWND